MSFCLIYYADSVLWGTLIALIPFAFLFWFLWDQRNLARSYVEVFKHYVFITEYPFGIKSVKQIEFSEIDCAKLIRPYSWKLRGARIKDIGVPYIVFYNKTGKQLFKILAYKDAIQFQQSVTYLEET